MAKEWQDIAAAKRAAILGTIPSEWMIPENIKPPDSQQDVMSFPESSGWFTPRELEVTDITANELRPLLASGKWSSEEVTKAFCKRAAAAHQLVGRHDIVIRVNC